MEQLNQRKFIALVIAISLASSLLVSVITIGLFTGSKPNQVAERIIERTPPFSPSEERAISERVLRQDELVVAVVKRAAPAVVSVVASKDVPVVEQFFVDPFGGDPFFRRFFGDEGLRIPQFRQKGTEKREVSSGSGFIVSAEGLVLTNKHVVSDLGADYTVFLNDGTKLPAQILARSPVQDLAVLKVSRGGMPTLRLGDSAKLDIGQSVVAIGNALGEFRNTVSVGVVSGLHRSIVAFAGGGGGAEQLQELIQTDAAINPGNSGGPLLNLRGEVVGINTAIAQGAENIGFAIAINNAKRDIESVLAVGRIVYPFLGIRYIMVTKEIAADRKLPVEYGALVVGDAENPAVVPSSPAAKAGLTAGDIILELSGKRIDLNQPLAALIPEHKVGATVSLKVLRNSQTLVIPVTLEERK